MDREKELLQRICALDDFCGSALFKDELPDWQLAKGFADLLTRLGHDDLLVHLLLARAYRHLGDPENAAAERRRCRAVIAEGKPLTNAEAEALLPTLEAEERLASINLP